MLSMDVDLFKWCDNKEWSKVREYLSSDAETEEDKKFNVRHYTDFMYRHYGTCLHLACRSDDAPAPEDIIQALIDIGGKEFVMKVDVYDKTALHWACYRNWSGASYNPSYNIIKMLIEVGGKDLVMAKSDYDGETPLTIATRHGASNIIKELLTVQSTTVTSSNKRKHSTPPTTTDTTKTKKFIFPSSASPSSSTLTKAASKNATTVVVVTQEKHP